TGGHLASLFAFHGRAPCANPCRISRTVKSRRETNRKPARLGRSCARSSCDEVFLQPDLPRRKATTPPVDRPLLSFLQCYLRRPSGLPYEAGAISEKRSHFRIRWPQALLILNNGFAAGCKLENDVDQIADHDRPLTASIVRLAVFDALRESGGHECRRSIRNECEISHGRCVTDHYRRAARIKRLSCNGADDRSFALSRPKRIERSEDHDWYAERPRECLRHHVGGYFGSRVGRLSLQRMGFIDRHFYRGAVNLAGRSVHDPFGTVLPRSFEHVQRAEHVCFDIGLRCEIGIGY